MNDGFIYFLRLPTSLYTNSSRSFFIGPYLALHVNNFDKLMQPAMCTMLAAKLLIVLIVFFAATMPLHASAAAPAAFETLASAVVPLDVVSGTLPLINTTTMFTALLATSIDSVAIHASPPGRHRCNTNFKPLKSTRRSFCRGIVVHIFLEIADVTLYAFIQLEHGIVGRFVVRRLEVFGTFRAPQRYELLEVIAHFALVGQSATIVT